MGTIRMAWRHVVAGAVLVAALGVAPDGLLARHGRERAPGEEGGYKREIKKEHKEGQGERKREFNKEGEKREGERKVERKKGHREGEGERKAEFKTERHKSEREIMTEKSKARAGKLEKLLKLAAMYGDKDQVAFVSELLREEKGRYLKMIGSSEKKKEGQQGERREVDGHKVRRGEGDRGKGEGEGRRERKGEGDERGEGEGRRERKGEGERSKERKREGEGEGVRNRWREPSKKE